MKILISDYDSTLYINEDDIRNNAKKIEEFRRNGNMFIISTARNYSSIKEECMKYNIITDYFFCDIGSVILDFDGNVIYEQHIEKNEIEKIEKIIQPYEDDLKITRYGTNSKIENVNNDIVEYKIKGNMNSLFKIKSMIDEKVSNVKTQITEDNRFIIHTSTKESIIEKFIFIEGINKDYIYTVGDELDDLEMLKRYKGYRMINCNPIVEKNIKNKVDNVSQLIDIIKEF